MPNLYIDFESRSAIDILKVGGAIYSEDPSTSILCLAYSVMDMSPVRLLTPDQIYLSNDSRKLQRLAADPNVIFVAHNAAFEQAMWRAHMVEKYGYPPIPIERWKCTMAKCYAHSLPGKLEKAALALKLTEQKDMEGHRIMLKLSKPRSYRQGKKDVWMPEWWEPEDVPEDFEKLYAYCMADVEVERKIDQTLRDLSPEEQKIWQIDQRMNQQGINIDLQLVERVIEYSDRYKAEIAEKFRSITGLNPSQREKVLAWFNERGTGLPNLQASTVSLRLMDADTDSEVRQVLKLYQQTSKSSLAKFPAFLERSKRGVLRESLQYHGAHTGRWTGRGVQIQNLKRPSVDIPTSVEAIML